MTATPSTVLLVAHGSPEHHHADVMRAVRDGVRARGVACEAAFLDHDRPRLADAATGLGAGAGAVAVPMLLNRAYHARVDIPAAIAALTAARPDLALRTAEPLGPDPLLVEAMRRRLDEAAAAPGAPTGDLAVVMAASGSSDDRARAEVVDVAASWSARHGTAVAHAFVAGHGPGVADAVTALRAAGHRDVALVPYLFAPGVLLGRASRLAREAGASLVADPLGPAPEVIDLVLTRARAA